MDAKTERRLQDARKIRLMQIAAGKDDRNAMKAIDLLNKMDGLYLTRVQIGINTPPEPIKVIWEDGSRLIIDDARGKSEQ